jgi:outer membrane protein assembly factor BamB
MFYSNNTFALSFQRWTNMLRGKKSLDVFLWLAIMFLFIAGSCQGQQPEAKHDWSQWLGPERLGVWHLDISKDTLVDSDLRKLWEVPVGTGYSGPTVSDGRVYLMDYITVSPNRERVLCLDADNGNILWIHEYECSYSVGYPTGPRASVLLHEGRAYSFGTMGDIYCLDAVTGKVLWYIDGAITFDIRLPVWGLSASPLVENDLLIIQLGGSPDACLVALDKETGEEVWRALDDEASYSAPIVIDQAGKRVLVCWTGDNLVGLNPETGGLYWKVPYERSRGIMNIATPVYASPYIFLSSFWDGSMLISLSQDTQEAELVWKRAGRNERNTDALHACMSTPVIYGDYVYGIDSYGELRCLELLTGDRVWADTTLVPHGRWANAHLVTQGDKTWAFNELGELILAELSQDGFKDLGRVELVKPFKVSPNPREGVNWAHPAFAGRRIYARSDAMLVCYEVVR